MTRKRLTLLIALFVCLTSSLRVASQSGGGYDLTWSTIDGGGGMLSTGGNYTLSGTIGQPDAGLHSGGSYTLRGGFWGAADGQGAHRIYLPIIVRRP